MRLESSREVLAIKKREMEYFYKNGANHHDSVHIQTAALNQARFEVVNIYRYLIICSVNHATIYFWIFMVEICLIWRKKYCPSMLLKTPRINDTLQDGLWDKFFTLCSWDRIGVPVTHPAHYAFIVFAGAVWNMSLLIKFIVIGRIRNTGKQNKKSEERKGRGLEMSTVPSTPSPYCCLNYVFLFIVVSVSSESHKQKKSSRQHSNNIVMSRHLWHHRAAYELSNPFVRFVFVISPSVPATHCVLTLTVFSDGLVAYIAVCKTRVFQLYSGIRFPLQLETLIVLK